MKEFLNKLVMRKLSYFDCYDFDKFSLGHHIILPTNEDADCLENASVEVECDVHIQPTSATSELQSKNTSYAPGTYLLVKFEKYNNKKSADALGFQYVCCVEKQTEDNSITVNGLRNLATPLQNLLQ